jgi:predicted ArsR family transcriptional regulator
MGKPTFSGQLADLATLLDPTREKLYRYVVQEPTPVSREQAANFAGINRAKAAFHLDKLAEAGLLRVEYRRLSGRAGRGAGRPSKLYARSRRRIAISVPHRDPELLARLLAQSMPETAASIPTAEAGHRYGHLLGARARRRLDKALDDDRLTGCVEDVAAELGFEPTSSGNETWARNCPFDPLSRELPGVVCQTALAILNGVIDGVGTRRIGVTRRERPNWCCVVFTRTPATS